VAYLEEFRNQIKARNYSQVVNLWEEYCQGDAPDSVEIAEILKLIKTSECAKLFGQYVTGILPLIDLIAEDKDRLMPLQLAFDIETTNTPELAALAIGILKKLFSDEPLFLDKLRLVGLRGGESFQGAFSNFFLLNHLKKGNFVLHTAGWGVGEIIDVSYLREQITIEFEQLSAGKKEISFKNGFKTLIPIPDTHFLARRFADPDRLRDELEANPTEVLRTLLSDLGPKTASEIKDEIADSIIPEKEYSKWWQHARGKIKKDPLIESPGDPKEPFRLLSGHAPWEERLEKAFADKHSFDAILGAASTLIRDFPEILKNDAAKARIIEKVQNLLLREKLSEPEHLQVLLFLENPLGVELEESNLKKFVLKIEKIDAVLQAIEIVALKKRFLSALRTWRSDWAKIFLSLLFHIEPSPLRDLLVKELAMPPHNEELKKKLEGLLDSPGRHPDALVWYFQKIISGDAPYFGEGADRFRFFEALLILFAHIGVRSESREIAKKIYTLLTQERFLLVRNFLKESSKEFAEEFLLLSSKCHGFSDHDKKILHSLVEVVHPDLGKGQHRDSGHLNVVWTTQEGYNRVYNRIKEIGTVELVRVAKEIEAARALGDLRENSEYKAAQEKRHRLQGELKMLGDQIRHAQVLTSGDISQDQVGVGVRVDLLGSKGEKLSYTILGPWDTNPELHILSFQSHLAQAMQGKKVGQKFTFKGEEFKILAIHSYL